MNRQRLYRCRHDRRLAGVAAGVAEYFDVDPSLVRVLWVISVFFGGLGLFLYIAMALIVPLEPEFAPRPGPWQPGSDQWGAPVAQGAGESTGEGERPSSGAPAAGPSQPGWDAPSAHRHANRRGSGFGTTFFGIVLILFGAIALLDAELPGLADRGRFLWPAFVLALGVLLVVTAMRRRPNEL